MSSRVLVTGAGGFIGHHLVTYLKKRGYWVRGADMKNPEYAPTDADEFALLDLRRWENCLQATEGRRRSVRAGRRHGRHGFHQRQSRADSPQQLADQHPYAGSRAPEQGVAGICIRRRRACIPSSSRPTPTSRR